MKKHGSSPFGATLNIIECTPNFIEGEKIKKKKVELFKTRYNFR